MIELSCRDECGAKLSVTDELALQGSGWQYLEITRAYRCPSCWHGLRMASGMRGCGGVTEDLLPPTSIGAIKKATAETILPPSLKG